MNPVIQRQELDDTENGNFYEYVENNIEELAENYVESEMGEFSAPKRWVTKERLVKHYQDGGQDHDFEEWLKNTLERRGEE